MLQNSDQDCLLACYSMILSSFGINISLSSLYGKEMIPPDGLSVSYLKKLNDKYRLDMKVYRIKDKEKTFQVIKKIKKPIIAHWDFNHFVLIDKVNKKTVEIINPEFGKMKISKEKFLIHFTNVLLTFKTKDDFTKEKEKIEFFDKLKDVLMNKNILLYSFSVILAQIVTLIFSIVVRDIINQKYTYLLSLFILLIIIFIQISSLVFKQKAQIKENVMYEKIIGHNLFYGLFNKPLLYFRNNTIGTLMEKLNIKTTIRDNILLKILPSILSFFSVIILFIYLFFVSKILTLLLSSIAIIYLLVSVFLYMKKNQLNIEYMQRNISFSSLAQEDLSHIDQIKAQAQELSTVKNWKDKNWDIVNSYNSILKIEGISYSFNQIFNYSSIILLMLLGIHLTKYGQVNIADLILFQSGMTIFSSSISQLQDITFEFSKIKISGEKINDLFLDNKIKKETTEVESQKALSLKNVSFGFDDQISIFKNVNFEIKKGEKVAIVGNSGSGKSTMLNILLGLYTCSGQIIYGYNNFRKQTGVVLQNMTLRKQTIYNNLVDEENCYDIKELNKILYDVNILKLINSLPHKIYSSVFQNGKNLSGGQIQRILIAKSLLNKNLVFWDEAFSSLDNYNRINIYNNVLKNKHYKDKTIILISHHLDVLPYVDKVIFIENQQVYFDKHSNLVNNNKFYNKFLDTANYNN
uniref:cysteine peptidase family C39 domain-containing protein n=1 Tax=Staphylococcus epidermidis TaxID=1282 RepID=UPI00155D88E6|nr:cysteine peptidase family C39 domain-containing protein [Staphylococcus epidermidis]